MAKYICASDSPRPGQIDRLLSKIKDKSPLKDNDDPDGFEPNERRAEQLSKNCRWLINQIDQIHMALCPGELGTWQDRARQAVAAAKYISEHNH